MDGEYVQTLVIGGGQAGLATAHELARRRLPCVVLDASARVGDAWRNRWESLRLFTPARYAGLPGMRFPGRGDAFPTKDQVADYLEAYAARFRLPVRTGTRVEALTREGPRFVATTAGGRRFEADQVIVAMSSFQVPRLPPFTGELDPSVRQLHAREYRNPSQLREGTVLVVGVGNSGAEIALELSRTRSVLLAGRETGEVPVRIESPLARHLVVRLVRFVGHHVLTVRTPIGRRVRSRLLHRGGPLVRVKARDLIAAGVERVARIVGVREGKPFTSDGRLLDVQDVIWCTGYTPGFSWLRLPVLDERGEPLHDRGIARGVPGLYFVGLHFLYALSSATLIGVARDARRVVRAVEARVRARVQTSLRPVAPQPGEART